MEPWMIEKLQEAERNRNKVSQLPLYLPIEHSRLTGSKPCDKEERERGSVNVDYTLKRGFDGITP
jgi:hypothetical protein